MKQVPLFRVYMHDDAQRRVAEVLNSGYIGQGAQVEVFERELREFTGADLLTTNSCTSALDLALHLIGVKPGDEVITTAQTCTASNGVIVNRGATPVFVDIDPYTGLIDPEDVERNLTSQTRAIMAVDWGGHPCDYDKLKSHGVPVVEDAAHAVGTMYKGRHVAKSGGDYVCFSFQAIKHLTSGDGGALVTPPEEYERAKLLRWFGLDRTRNEAFRCAQNITEVGYKYHMNDINAAIGSANLDALPWILGRHEQNAMTLRGLLSGCSNIKTPSAPRDNCMSSWWLFSILVKDPEAFALAMHEYGVACSPVHKRNDSHDAFKKVARVSTKQTGIDSFAAHQVAIPVGWWVSPEDLEHVAESARKCARAA